MVISDEKCQSSECTVVLESAVLNCLDPNRKNAQFLERDQPRQAAQECQLIAGQWPSLFKQSSPASCSNRSIHSALLSSSCMWLDRIESIYHESLCASWVLPSSSCLQRLRHRSVVGSCLQSRMKILLAAAGPANHRRCPPWPCCQSCSWWWWGWIVLGQWMKTIQGCSLRANWWTLLVWLGLSREGVESCEYARLEGMCCVSW